MLDVILVLVGLAIYFPLAIYFSFIRPKKKQLEEQKRLEAERKNKRKKCL